MFITIEEDCAMMMRFLTFDNYAFGGVTTGSIYRHEFTQEHIDFIEKYVKEKTPSDFFVNFNIAKNDDEYSILFTWNIKPESEPWKKKEKMRVSFKERQRENLEKNIKEYFSSPVKFSQYFIHDSTHVCYAQIGEEDVEFVKEVISKLWITDEPSLQVVLVKSGSRLDEYQMDRYLYNMHIYFRVQYYIPPHDKVVMGKPSYVW